MLWTPTLGYFYLVFSTLPFYLSRHPPDGFTRNEGIEKNFWTAFLVLEGADRTEKDKIGGKNLFPERLVQGCIGGKLGLMHLWAFCTRLHFPFLNYRCVF